MKLIQRNPRVQPAAYDAAFTRRQPMGRGKSELWIQMGPPPLLPAQLGGVKSYSDFFPLTEAAKVFVQEWGKRDFYSSQ